MNTFLFILLVLLLIAVLERSNRRQTSRPHGPSGSPDHIDRDWDRIQLDLLAAGDARPSWTTTNHNGPRSHRRNTIDHHGPRFA